VATELSVQRSDNEPSSTTPDQMKNLILSWVKHTLIIFPDTGQCRLHDEEHSDVYVSCK